MDVSGGVSLVGVVHAGNEVRGFESLKLRGTLPIVIEYSDDLFIKDLS